MTDEGIEGKPIQAVNRDLHNARQCSLGYQDTVFPELYYSGSTTGWCAHIHIGGLPINPARSWYFYQEDFWLLRKITIYRLAELGNPVAELLVEAMREE